MVIVFALAVDDSSSLLTEPSQKHEHNQDHSLQDSLQVIAASHLLRNIYKMPTKRPHCGSLKTSHSKQPKVIAYQIFWPLILVPTFSPES